MRASISLTFWPAILTAELCCVASETASSSVMVRVWAWAAIPQNRSEQPRRHDGSWGVTSFTFRVFGFRAGTALMNRHVQHGDDNQREEHGTDQAKGDGAAQGRPHTRTGKDHRSDPDSRRHGSEKDRPQPALTRFNGCFLDFNAFRHSGADIVDEDDGIAHHDAAQTYDAQERRKAEGIPRHQQAERCAQQARAESLP